MEDPQLSPAAADIDRLTRMGSKELNAYRVSSAIEYFEEAYKQAQNVDDDFIQRVCSFNLGAVHIAERKPAKGLEYLHKAIPPPDSGDQNTNGDLFYNFGLAYELTGSKDEAVKYLELSLEEYQKHQSNASMEGEVGNKLGTIYSELNSPLQAARAYGIASSGFSKVPDLANQAQSLCRQATSLFKGNKVQEALRLADDCMLVCQKLPQNPTLGKLYNELGLLYTQGSEFTRAQTCFELALPLSQGPEGDKKQQAVISQNLGAVYNSLGDYQRSLSFHESAAVLHAELHNRNAQGQCFTNLAYAYSRLGDTQSAGECYLHALQAAKDTGDKHAQWQAMEGLGAVCFHDVSIDRAIRYYQMALSALVSSGENNPVAHDRLVGKLRDALQYQQIEEDAVNRYGKLPLDVRVNDMSRPSTRQEMLEMERLREIREEKMAQAKKIPYEFDRIALGLGAYDTDSDLSVPKSRLKSNRQKEWQKERLGSGKLDRARAGSGRGDRNRSRPSRDEVDRIRSEEVHNQDKKLQNGKHTPKRRLSRRMSSKRSNSVTIGDHVGRRQAYLEPLLNPEGYDSEEEWKQRMKKRKQKIDDDHKYVSKLRPPSTPGDSEEERPRRHRKKKHVRRHSDTDTDLESLVRRREREEEERHRSLRSIAIDRHRRHATESETDTIPPDADFYTKSSRAQGSRSLTDSLRSRSSEDKLNNTESRTLSQYEQHLMRTEEDQSEETESVTESETETGSETETETDTEVEGQADTMIKSAGFPDFTAPFPPGGKPGLRNTYEKPGDALPPGDHNKHLEHRGSKNYFKDEVTSTLPGVSEGQGHMKGEGHLDHERQGEGRITGGGSTVKFSQPDPNDPDYQTIRSLLRTQEQTAGPSGVGSSHPQRILHQQSEQPPDLPPRNTHYIEGELEGLSRAEQEEFLHKINMRRAQKNAGAETTTFNEEDVELPMRRKGKAASRACIVM